MYTTFTPVVLFVLRLFGRALFGMGIIVEDVLAFVYKLHLAFPWLCSVSMAYNGDPYWGGPEPTETRITLRCLGLSWSRTFPFDIVIPDVEHKLPILHIYKFAGHCHAYVFRHPIHLPRQFHAAEAFDIFDDEE